EGERNFFSACDTKEARHRVSVIVKLVRQFVHGEVAHEAVFDDVKTALTMSSEEGLSSSDFLSVFSLRFLDRLGYIASPQRFSAYLADPEWWTLPSLPPEALVSIDKAKQASHL